MSTRPDLVAYDDSSRLRLIVEVKNKLGTTVSWAVGMHRDLLGVFQLRQPDYFLFALPDRFYLWVGASDADNTEPSYVVDPKPFLQPYFQEVAATPDTISGVGFESIIEWFLENLAAQDELPDELQSSNEWLVKSGLWDALQSSRFAMQSAL